MNSLIGARVRFTVCDTEGTNTTLEGTLAHLATQASPALGPGQSKQWDCLISVLVDNVHVLLPFNAPDLELVTSDPDEAHVQMLNLTIDDLRKRVTELDDENATLTAQIRAMSTALPAAKGPV